MTELVKKDDTDNWRSTAAQLVATLAFSMLCINVGFIIGMTTIVIGALRHDDSPLRFSEEEASWFGSLIFIVQPMGSLVSAFLQDVLGRKKCLMMINIPQMVAWVIIYFATSTTHLFVAMFIMGIAVGFLEAPILSYIGEITQPRLRGILTSFGGIFYNAGMMLESFVGAVLPWRTMVLLNIFGPLVGFVAMCLVPESPAWLVTKGRVKDAENAYRWLRGWVQPETVKEELGAMVSYVKNTQAVKMTDKGVYAPVPTKEVSGTPEKKRFWQLLMEPDILRAFRLILIYFLVTACASLSAMRPFFIEILDNLNLPITPHVVVAICGGLMMLGAASLGVFMRVLGKRGLTFLSLGLSVFCCFGLGMYLVLQINMPWVPVVLFCLSYYVSTMGIISIPWILIMELFPLRVRGVAGGISGALGYSLMFLVIKTYYNLVAIVNVSGVCFVYGIVGLIGFVYLYFELLETEGIPLEVIERRLRERRSARSKWEDEA